VKKLAARVKRAANLPVERFDDHAAQVLPQMLGGLKQVYAAVSAPAGANKLLGKVEILIR